MHTRILKFLIFIIGTHLAISTYNFYIAQYIIIISTSSFIVSARMSEVSLKNLGAYCRGVDRTSIRGGGDLAKHTKTKTLENILKTLYKICTLILKFVLQFLVEFKKTLRNFEKILLIFILFL